MKALDHYEAVCLARTLARECWYGAAWGWWDCGQHGPPNRPDLLDNLARTDATVEHLLTQMRATQRNPS